MQNCEYRILVFILSSIYSVPQISKTSYKIIVIMKDIELLSHF